MAKWWLDDEDFVAQARELRAQFRAGNVHLSAPTHLHYELANLLRRAVRLGRISQTVAEAAIGEVTEMPLVLTDAPEILVDALDLSLRLNLSLYDACYLVLAELSDSILISDDRNMRRALGGSHPRITWLEHYQP